MILFDGVKFLFNEISFFFFFSRNIKESILCCLYDLAFCAALETNLFFIAIGMVIEIRKRFLEI